MATKTITLELDAYEALKRRKRSERDSFSAVVRRAKWDDDPMSAGEIVKYFSQLAAEGDLPSLEAMDQLAQIQKRTKTSTSKWPKNF